MSVKVESNIQVNNNTNEQKKTKKRRKRKPLNFRNEDGKMMKDFDPKILESFKPRQVKVRNSRSIKISSYNKKNKKQVKDDWGRVPQCHTNGGWIYKNNEIVKNQRGIVWEVIKNLAGNIFKTEKDLATVTLPVTLFEPRSYLHRIFDSYSFAPLFLKLAAQQKDPAEKMKLVIACMTACLHQTVAQQKPFNPILGETFQGCFTDGSEIFAEQVCHHPPISAFEIIDKDNLYHLHGRLTFKCKYKGYAIDGHSHGTTTIDFADGSKITCTFPILHLTGVVMGDRIVEYISTATYNDPINNLSCELTFNPEPQGWIKSIFSTQEQTPSDMFNGQIIQKDKKNKEKVICEVNGSWLGRIDFDDQTYWALKRKLRPVDFLQYKDVLPSDSQFRQDLIELRNGNLDKSAIQKKKLEVKQRRDATLRKKARK
ncbi:oxysterol-binding protein [Anaeramoeba flamelloides]|uniref:Oxysterol-binding protein n=1 Tax=Anaeramoeba flamelloides TaxID=1746091 RepID=A0AAV7ZKI9_9EUKA|nr:oxysterol-binding protein [Anaeramoeba flamelloides]|eukprot:Anaeramoba_flamelloidesa85137_159.p1 GENE.a85137_159~~a85137_159.p1  ORF type:complete len:427 (+),score=99.32 a85137_159:41-1321(+)